jgi:membrane-associated phospholipid phosphatase
VHFFSDVIGAVIVGTAWLLAMTAAFSAWRREEHKPPVEPGEGLEPEQRQRLRGPQILRLRKGSRAALPPK